ncbi:MAG: Branched-chain amino acid aminotransferase, partial [uncultured Thermoleophilia bacterium]
AGSREDLVRRAARRLGRRPGPRPGPRAPLRLERLRGHPGVRDRPRHRRLPPDRAPGAPAPLRRDVLHGHPVHERRARGRDPRDRRRQRAAVVLHPAARLPGVQRARGQPARLPGPGRHRRLALGRVPRRGRPAARRPGHDLVLAAHRAEHHPGRREGRRAVPELAAREDRGGQARLRGGDPAQRAGLHRGRHRREHLRGARGPDLDAAHGRLLPARDHPRGRDRARRGPRLRDDDPRPHPRRPVLRGRGLHDRHGGRGHARGLRRRPRDRARSGDEGDPGRVLRRGARSLAALPRASRVPGRPGPGVVRRGVRAGSRPDRRHV